jgi:hypothetical protein
MLNPFISGALGGLGAYLCERIIAVFLRRRRMQRLAIRIAKAKGIIMEHKGPVRSK